MGVHHLWPILEPVRQHTHLHSLGGKTIAVDLSLWVCEAQTVRKMIGTVMKPHLRNLFFRISFLTLMDVKLIFVMEGEPPKLKADVISKRNQIRYGSSGKTSSQRTGRSHFKSVLRECLDMLQCLGIPWVQAAGEAEAMCAYLNANGYVDGCLTNDGDAFLYGAQTVYRNFTMNTKDPHVDCYTMSSIKSNLGLDREALVGLAVLLGCDYLPKGVPGVGKEQALKLIQTLRGQSLLHRFNQWNEKSFYSDPQAQVVKKLAHCSVCSHPGSPKDHERNGCRWCQSDRYCEPHDYDYRCPCEWHLGERERQLSDLENSIKKKACSCEGFPFPEVIQEFLSNKDKLQKVIRSQRPDLLLFQRFTLEKMDWPNHYACEKLLMLLTHYDMVERKLGRRNANQLQPIRLPECMKIKPKENVLRELDDVMNLQSHMNLEHTSVTCPEQNPKFPLEIPPYSKLLQESSAPSQSSLLSPGAAACLERQDELMSSPDPVATHEIKKVSKLQTSESSQPTPLSHNLSVVTDLQLTAIDWESTSFSYSPALPKSAVSHSLKSELEPAVHNSFDNTSERLSGDSEWCTTNIKKASDGDLRKTGPEEHLLSGLTALQLQDLPLKERIRMKSSYAQDKVQPDIGLKALSPLQVKEPCFANSVPVCPAYLSKKFTPIHLQNEYRNSDVLKGDQSLQESYKINAALNHGSKVDAQTTQKMVMTKSVCLDRPSSDEESAPVCGKAKYRTHKSKQCSQSHHLLQGKNSDPDRPRGHKMHANEAQQHVQAYSNPGNEEKDSLGSAQRPLSLPQYPNHRGDPDACMASPLPLCQRLKLRFQST
ncbi:flap endonuclease GEN homolog 1 [Echinops telfairi]|uniref:Flap endonuclease GEN homolog 1 n=1 Tax=Echinops telfairi TaxID=9371 RepID=A0ABM0IBP8_ECHTE|nr:flap endonuclease GEN homolog 1 [Echinops telfairi]